jgi:hypothetical protein
VKVASDAGRADLPKRRRPHLRASKGAESAPHVELAPEREAVIDEGIEIFSRRYSRTIGPEEARQMIQRLTAFFDLLAEWEQRAQRGQVEGERAA